VEVVTWGSWLLHQQERHMIYRNKLDDEVSDDKNQPSISHLGKLEHADLDFNYQFTLYRERSQSNQHNNLYLLILYATFSLQMKS